MLELKKGVDILSHVGGVASIDEAREIFEDKMNAEHDINDVGLALILNRTRKAKASKN